jgi:hypothetical protein
MAGCFPPNDLPFPEGGFSFFSGEIVDLDTAASYFGLTESELRDELEDGNSLADVARDRNRSVEGLVDELADEAEERIDEAVAEGRLLEETAARLKDGLEFGIVSTTSSAGAGCRSTSASSFPRRPSARPALAGRTTSCRPA